MKEAEVEVRKILVINLAFIGDVLLATPVCRGLRAAYPNAWIDLLVVPINEPIADGNPYIDRVLIYDKRGRHKGLGELWKLIKALRREKYDLGLTMNFASRGAMLAWASGIKRRVGYNRQHSGWFLTDIADSSRAQIRHETENNLAILHPLDISVTDTGLAFQVRETDRQSLFQKKLFSQRPAIAICPFGSNPKKSWSLAGYAELVKVLVDTWDCFLIGAAADQKDLEKIADQSSRRVRILAGELTLGELAAFLQEVKLLISVDTGPMHLANAVGTPVIALFGPTDPRIWGPRGSNDQVIKVEVPCSPCWCKGECEGQHCMGLIKVAEVLQRIDKVINS